MKRLYMLLILVFGAYALLISLYVWKADLFHIPYTLVGTAADPHTFMTNEEIAKSESLSRIRSLAYFINAPLEIGLLILLLGVGVRLRKFVEKWFVRSWLQMIAFIILFTGLLGVLLLPLDYLLFVVDHRYGVSNETTMTFWTDHGKDFVINGLGTLFMVGLFRWMLKRSPGRWWLWLWTVSIPIILFITFIQPVLLDPLYNDFQPLQDQELKAQILHLAAQSHIPTDQVYEVNMSERTTTINAYVNGIGDNARIVLWDTILNKLQPKEILTVMAHEMGHYVERHIYWGIAYGLLLSLIGFWLACHMYRFFINRWGAHWGIRGDNDLAALPILLMILTLMNFASAPAQNAFSRILEHRADVYAMKMTGDGDSAIHAFQQIAKQNLSPVTQPKLIQWFRGSHPTIMERIMYFKQYAK
ncbi:M48 family metallopeptidase [Paenibacillus sp. N3.4]|uniref:M48 family metallopeptidase n=1 Tax=Paenibacillus sp. N3.4 TaxID=2603222 RepID=UPI0011C731BE|nr:M48 family metallopeptidase [Paenibacillus sp. N3.4]TXK76390.1 M48 family metallopeptidase [Paenibacillus sp. N3.4]